MLPFDLHVLGLPPAFTLSQDQTLHLKVSGIASLFLECLVRPTPLLAVRVDAITGAYEYF